jgi:GntR family transcriptional regulator, transcriptional repressor for pyruvate dehydrogenase complex
MAKTAAEPVQAPRGPKASGALAEALRERILSGEFPVGTPLPPERELVSQTQNSRTTVREALRVLEAQGMVRIKTGRSGGAFVQALGEESVASSAELLIRGRQIRMTTLLETRESLEPQCARLAAKYRTEDDLERLEAANHAIGQQTNTLADFLQANLDWHLAVAAASHNELLTGFMLALSRAIYAGTDNSGFVDDEVRATTVKAHRAITAAIRDQDPDAAVRRMGRHVHSFAEALLEVDERTEIEID